MSNAIHARKNWIDICRFHELDEHSILSEVSKRVHSGRSHPLVLLDLDSTLYEVAPRTYQILLEWLKTEGAGKYPQVAAALRKAEPLHVGYSVRDTLLAVGLDPNGPAAGEMEQALTHIRGFWETRFFSSDYLKYDHAYPGAAEFTRAIYQLGAQVVYLTGRDEPRMGDGTRGNLIRDGFPWEVPRTHLLMKEAAEIPDLQHKVEAADYIRKHGTLVASFENEPPNVVAIYDLFPEAMHVFVDTVCSEHPALAREGLYRIAGFSSFLAKT